MKATKNGLEKVREFFIIVVAVAMKTISPQLKKQEVA